MSTRTLCFELGVEELPAGELKSMALSLESGICKGIQEAGLNFENSKVLWTPRRLAVVISGLQQSGEATTTELLGPPLAAAKDNDGAWTPAAIGFATVSYTHLRAHETLRYSYATLSRMPSSA